MFDVEQYFTESKAKMMEHINEQDLPTGRNGKSAVDVNEIVLSYLVHCGFSETAERFMQDSRCETAKLSGTSNDVLNSKKDVTLMASRRGKINDSNRV
jgi:hypothetical protein